MSDSRSRRSKWDDSTDNVNDPAKAAAYAAAQINAKLSAVAAGSSSEFIKKIDINHLKNRYMLTRGATQQEIGEQTGADVTTRGRYYPEPQKATDSEPPLHLVITAPSQESLDAATAKINELIETAEVPLPTRPQRYEQDRFRHDRESSGGERYGRSNFDRPPRRFHEQRVEVDIIEGPHFNLRAKIVGPQGSFVKYINQTTGCRVQVRGRGSGFIEYDSGVESKEPLYIHISTPREEQLPRAVKMAKDLVATIKNDVENRHASKSATSQQYDQAGGEGQYDYSNYDYQQYYNQYGYYGQQQYDPSYYDQYYQQQQQDGSAPPPPPPEAGDDQDGRPPSPPPPPSSDTSSRNYSYNSVPPPPNY